MHDAPLLYATLCRIPFRNATTALPEAVSQIRTMQNGHFERNRAKGQQADHSSRKRQRKLEKAVRRKHNISVQGKQSLYPVSAKAVRRRRGVHRKLLVPSE